MQLIRRNELPDKVLEKISDANWTMYLHTIRITSGQHAVNNRSRKSQCICRISTRCLHTTSTTKSIPPSIRQAKSRVISSSTQYEPYYARNKPSHRSHHRRRHPPIFSKQRNSTPGTDNISYRHIKKAPASFMLAIQYTFILGTGFIPRDWKISKTLMFPKPSKTTNSVSSYRPIQLTTTFSQILDRILVYRLHHDITEKSLRPIYQTSFRPNFSINDQLLTLTKLQLAKFIMPSII